MASNHLGSAPMVSLGSTSMGTVPNHHIGSSQSGHYVDSKMHIANMGNIPRNSSPGGNTRTNGEISINTNHCSSSSQNMKRSPGSMSPSCTDNSTADLLVDSPSK